MSWWVTFANAPGVCVDHGTREAAMTLASSKGTVRDVKPLPYPASPRMPPVKNTCPSFCYRPNTCAGRAGCPNPNGRSCTS